VEGELRALREQVQDLVREKEEDRRENLMMPPSLAYQVSQCAAAHPYEEEPELLKWLTTASLLTYKKSIWVNRPRVKHLQSLLEEFWGEKDRMPLTDSGPLPVDQQMDLAFLADATNSTLIIETGMAIATSTVALLGSFYARDGSDTFVDSLTVHSIDPYQQQGYKKSGLNNVQAALERFGQTFEGYKGREPSHVYHNNSAALSMAELYASTSCADLIFMDDGHKYDDNMLELYFSTRLLRPGGILVIDDIWMPSVKVTLAYATSNLPFVQIHGLYERGVVLLKTGNDDREWDFHVEF
jgi:hypothetical protein